MRTHHALLGRLRIPVVLAASIACGEQKPQIVQASDRPVWGDEPRLVEEMRIGALNGAEEYTFGRIRNVAIGLNGAIYVADDQVPVIRAYDAGGRFARNLGRKGSGPGEYQSLDGLHSMVDGHLALWDGRSRRITVFTADGDVVTSFQVSKGTTGDDHMRVDHEGIFYLMIQDRPATVDGEPDRGWVRVSPAGRILDTIPVPKTPDPQASFLSRSSSGYDRPFTREMVSTISPLGYLISGFNEEYALEERRRSEPVLRIERSYTPVKLEREERTEWEARARWVEQRIANPSLLPALPNGARRILPPPRQVRIVVPQTKPAFRELQTDVQGRIWVRRYVKAESHPAPLPAQRDDHPQHVWREKPTFDVFEPDGRFLGTVTLPLDAYFRYAQDKQVWATVTGAQDEQYIVRFRLEPSGG